MALGPRAAERVRAFFVIAMQISGEGCPTFPCPGSKGLISCAVGLSMSLRGGVPPFGPRPKSQGPIREFAPGWAERFPDLGFRCLELR